MTLSQPVASHPVTLQPLASVTPACAQYVARGQLALSRLLPGVNFHAMIWETTALAKTTATRTQKLYFTRHGSTTIPLPTLFAEPAKAWVAVKGGTASRLMQRVFAVRWLWMGIEQRLGAAAATAFAWNDLRQADVRAAEQLMLDTKLSKRTVNKAATTFADFVRDLATSGVGPAITYTPMTPRQGDTNNHRVDDLEARGRNVLSDAAQAALADIFATAVTEQDRFYSALLALLIASGLRWNEAVTLPLEPLEEQVVETRDVTGALTRVFFTYIRRHKAKSQRAGGNGRPNTELQPLTEQQAELARLTVARLRKLCGPARSLAARLERSAPRWVWPEASRPDFVWQSDLVRVLATSASHANSVLRQIGEPDPDAPRRGARHRPRRATLAAFETYMTKRQDWAALDVVKPGPGHQGQRATQSLLCLRVNELHSTKATLPLIDPPSHNGLETWLEGHPDEGLPSVFERFEREHGLKCREPDGSLVKIDSHMCRRLFVTAGLTAGATMLDMARWQGREHVGDLRSYDQRSMAEKLALVKDAIMTGRLRGQVVQAYVRLAEDVRDEWLTGQVQAMHVTPLGLCVHDFSTAPCPLALNCLKGCTDYLHDPADPGQVQQLVQLERRTTRVLELMQPDIAAGRVAPAWVEEQQTTLVNVRRALHTDAPGDGRLMRPFADGESRFAPLDLED